MKVRFPDGTVINGLALSERRVQDPDRDYGLYLDAGWCATWPAAVVDWEDFGLPTSYETGAEQIRKAFRRAKIGQRFEVGCKGGCGRTGTVLACLAILSGIPAGDAVTWIRANYHRTGRIVETADQEWWVQWFDAYVHGREAPVGPLSRCVS